MRLIRFFTVLLTVASTGCCGSKNSHRKADVLTLLQQRGIEAVNLNCSIPTCHGIASEDPYTVCSFQASPASRAKLTVNMTRFVQSDLEGKNLPGVLPSVFSSKWCNELIPGIFEPAAQTKSIVEQAYQARLAASVVLYEPAKESAAIGLGNESRLFGKSTYFVEYVLVQEKSDSVCIQLLSPNQTLG